MAKEELSQLFHFRQSLPSQCPDPTQHEVEHTGPGLVGPQAIELLTEDIRFEQPSIRREQRLEFHALRPAHRLPTPQQEPAFPSPVSPASLPFELFFQPGPSHIAE